MTETAISSLEEPNALLTGGPQVFGTDNGRIWFAKRLDQVVKLQNGNRYEHFAPTPETVLVDGRSLRVFRWQGYTKIAE